MPLFEPFATPLVFPTEPRPHYEVVIVGGGLAGLTAASQLARAGTNFCLIEARHRLGGRILSADTAGQPIDDGFDLGPSWFWPQMHPDMAAVIGELGLEAFPQACDGDLLFQHASGRIERYPGLFQNPKSMRLSGGTGALIRALAAAIPRNRIHLGASVARIHLSAEGAQVEFAGARGNTSVRADHVICAVPPRLLAEHIAFDPAPDAAALSLWRRTPTWMAPHAKFFALYDRPFWRAAGLSGMAHSQTGPLGEIHDATTASGKAALFGFVDLPAEHRQQPEAVVAAAVAQLGQIFGPEALTPLGTIYKDWAVDPLTATALDQTAGAHPIGGHQTWASSTWNGRIILAGSETAARDPGYLAGAIEAGMRAAKLIVQQLQPQGGPR